MVLANKVEDKVTANVFTWVFDTTEYVWRREGLFSNTVFFPSGSRTYKQYSILDLFISFASSLYFQCKILYILNTSHFLKSFLPIKDNVLSQDTTFLNT